MQEEAHQVAPFCLSHLILLAESSHVGSLMVHWIFALYRYYRLTTYLELTVANNDS
jgi:hypothetical protein